jgi:hypothetical protein
MTNGAERWNIDADDSAESGSNSGSNLQFLRFADNGTFINAAMQINRDTGNVGIGTTSPGAKLHLDGGEFRQSGAAGTFRLTRVLTGTSLRWDYGVSDGAESGSNAGSDFVIGCYADNGTFLRTVLFIPRSTGHIQPGTDNAQNLGSGSARFATVFANTGEFSGTVSGAAASANTHLMNRITADVRYLGETYRNRIVNPAMQISQERGTALVDVTNGTIYTVDQWFASLSTTPGGTLRVQQVASATPGGSSFRLRHTVQVADASIAAGDFYAPGAYIEGQMIADARFGTASARQIVVRFGVRSSLAGTFGVRLTNSAGNRSYVTTITIAGGEINTDLLRTIVIPGDTSGTWLTDTGVGFTLQITLAAGTTFQTTAGSWQAGNFYTTSGQTNFMGTGSATFELFDVGLYVDALAIGAAPSWELPDFANDLGACQRYVQKSYNYADLPGAITLTGVSTGRTSNVSAVNNAVISVSLGRRMRVNAVVTPYGPSTGTANRMRDGGGTESVTTVSEAGEQSFNVFNSGTALATNGTAFCHWLALARF